jgi:putative zinc finger/helix-turn-helix YgiT family protein
MSDNTNMPSKPFPWRCMKCQQKLVFSTETDYVGTAKHDGRAYDIHIPALSIPTCRNCGTRVLTSTVDDAITAALRGRIGLLTPEEILGRRNQFQLNQQELAEQIGVAKETISRWETGALIQSRAMDNLLRLYFESEEVRGLLARRFAPHTDRFQATKETVVKLDQAIQSAREELETLKRQFASVSA